MGRKLALLLSMIGIGVSASAQQAYKDMDVASFAKYITTDSVQVVDVRTPGEYQEGHLEGAVLVDVKGSDFVKEAQTKLDKTRPLAVYCRSGKRSAMASAILSRQGYQVVNLLGGFLAWEAAGLPVKK